MGATFCVGIVAIFRTDKGLVYYAYPILSERTASECVPYRKVGDEIHLIENGRLYVVKSLPNLYRYEKQDWKMWDVRQYTCFIYEGWDRWPR